MPIYAYRCASCGHAQDVLQKMSDPLLSICPACGAEAYTKQLTAAGFQLKGSGWYVTDFREGKKKADGASKEGGNSESKGDSSGDSSGESSGEGKGDAKSDSKSEAKSGAKADSKSDAPTKSASTPSDSKSPASGPAPAPTPAPTPSGPKTSS